MFSRIPESFCRRQVLLAIAALLFVQVAALWFEGRIAWSDGGPGFWSAAWAHTTSQHLLDPYSLSHVLHGVLLYFALIPLARWVSLPWRWVLAIAIEVGWEVLENSPIIIERYRTETASLDYVGDSLLNSLGDTLMMSGGFLYAALLPWYASALLFVGFELLALYLARDNLTLNVLMLLWPIDAIKDWQMQLLSKG